jgi:selenoprotein W-related protein
VSAARDLLTSYQHVIDSLTFTTGSGGVFDVRVDGDVLYSKHAEHRHAEPGEVLARFRDRYAGDTPVYGT